MNRIPIRKHGEKGNTMLEFGLIAIMVIVPLYTGTITGGLSVTKAIQVSQVSRNANILTVRNIDLSPSSGNQGLILKNAQGLGIGTLSGTNYVANPSGKGVIILTKVIHIGPTDCAAGGLPPNAGGCPNYDTYVISNRISIGNTSRADMQSIMGNPSGTPQMNPPPNSGLQPGDLTVSERLTNPGNRASGFPGLVNMTMGNYTFVSEVYADVSELNFFGATAPILYARNMS